MARLLTIATLLVLSVVGWAATKTVNVGNDFFFDIASGTTTTTITAGDTVNWTWTAGFHSSTSVLKTGPEAWDSGNAFTPHSFSRVFNTPGSYAYLCTVHSTVQKGTIVVVPATSSITATVNLDSYLGNAPAIDFNVSVDGGAPVIKHLDQNGRFTVTGLTRAAHSLHILQSRSFLSMLQSVNTSSGDATATFNLENGDTDSTNACEDNDVINIILDFDQAGGTASGFPFTDLNGDGIVDDFEVIIVIVNFGDTGT